MGGTEQNSVQAAPPTCPSCIPTLGLLRSYCQPLAGSIPLHLSIHLQSGLRNTTNERLSDVRITLGPLGMVMPQQRAQRTR